MGREQVTTGAMGTYVNASAQARSVRCGKLVSAMPPAKRRLEKIGLNASNQERVCTVVPTLP